VRVAGAGAASPLVVLDANAVFSAALGGPAFVAS